MTSVVVSELAPVFSIVRGQQQVVVDMTEHEHEQDEHEQDEHEVESDDDTGFAPTRTLSYTGIPLCEGKEVQNAKIKIGSTLHLDVNDLVVGLDDIVEMKVTVRVTGINHTVNENTGLIDRVQTCRPIDVEIVQVLGG